ncbi:hypothetical protein BOTBODRAFT_163606 [Botryobasidium botryosum FD-172 SS1]|uniref:UbiA prenyltransferase n=1 Tax=Botryobasidium botryosum (strain FD-172 SS1) TaxID=930990 RepID=A0A067M4N2_BOTB1|nr:hypothetical protein BOTBODRAFT_163606 [Botryobasidium botryosum FD-172 SS1]
MLRSATRRGASDAQSSLASFSTRIGKTASACFRLGRFHTLMGYVIFTTPAVLTVVLYHACRIGSAPSMELVQSAARLTLSLVVCILSYRGAGLAWDDIIDRDIDGSVARTKSRPLPAGDISLSGALLYCGFQISVTSLLFQRLLPMETSLVNAIGWMIFLVYPFLKFFTYWAQAGGSLLMAWVVPVAWVACVCTFEPSNAATVADKWSYVASIAARDWMIVLPIFMIEFLFSFFHETVYGCQDTGDDIKLGVYSTSILFGYKRGPQILTPLVFIYLGVIFYSTLIAGLHAHLLSLIPSYVLITEIYALRMEDPRSCGRFAKRGIEIKIILSLTFWVSFLWKACVA